MSVQNRKRKHDLTNSTLKITEDNKDIDSPMMQSKIKKVDEKLNLEMV